MAMAVKHKQGSSRQQHDVKVKFIETQFISSDAASFKAVVQRLTGKSSLASPPPQPQRPRPCRPAFADDAGSQQQQQQDGYSWVHEQSGNNGPEGLYELCDFSDLLYAATAGARRDGGFPY